MACLYRSSTANVRLKIVSKTNLILSSQGMENYQPHEESTDRYANPDNLRSRLENLKIDSPRRVRRRHSMSSDSPSDNNTPMMVWPFGELPQEVPKEQRNRPPSLVLSSVPQRIPRRRRFDSEPPLAFIKTSELPDVFSPTSPLSPFSGLEFIVNFFQKSIETIDSGTDCDDFDSEFAMSLSGGLIDNNEISCLESFKKNIITFQKFSSDPKKFITDPRLVLRMGTKYYNWTACSAIIISMMVYQLPLSEEKVKGLQSESIRKRSWFSGYWPRSVSTSEHYSRNPAPIKQPKLVAALELPAANGAELSRSFSVPSPDFCPIFREGGKLMKKTLVLSSDELKKLNLKYGENTIDFWLTTMLQGTTKISASIYLWNSTDNIVISDIDGTITKSDVMGNIFPAIGKDWSQKGVTHLYQRIHNNGYKILYLSSRAIGQAHMTKNYLKSVIQDGVSLPSGPVMLNPTSLFNAFHKEVIVRRPEEFKISCLHGIRQVFADSDEKVNPFWAGFGNRPTDVKSYRNVGITDRRIYIVNPLGHLKEQKTSISGYSTCYKDLGDNCDHFFPIKNRAEPEQTVSSYKYWKTDLPQVDFSMLT
ncbi:unnamed protein product [Oikopleura dioica]|uniref:LNS2/PITP domain-containing protein n=2 Tax=Oikopleura dioica TaxID=34765 RepID=E4WS11_OIKDI|nr:unnamed protein product [Oikopleura dioica]